MIRLVFHSGPQAGRDIITAAAAIRIGRHPQDNDLVLDDPKCSTFHCVLRRTPEGVYLLEDLGATNGTFVNGQRVQKVLLAAGDRFFVGDSEVEVRRGRPRLQVVSGPRAGAELPIGAEPLTIGRAPDNALRLEEGKVSAYHAAVLAMPVGFVLQDNGSTNGVFVHGIKVERHHLTDGDRIAIGDSELWFLVDSEQDEETGRELTAGTDEARARLAFVAGPHMGMVVSLGSEPLRFGRDPELHVVLADPQISARHCEVVPGEHGFILRDLGSTNGTWVNAERISKPTPLLDGALISLGASVVEFQVAGGVKVEQGLTMATVIAEGALQLPSLPKYVINGAVLSKVIVQLGRSPQSDLFIDDEEVDRTHCEIAWDRDGFYVEDRSERGTYLSDRRVVREQLQDGHVLRLGPRIINVAIRGNRCQLDEIDAAAALAAIQVAREQQFDLRQATVDPANSGPGATGYKTIMRMDVANVEAMVAERKKKLQRKGAPLWRPTTDIQPQPLRKLAVSTAVGAAVALSAYLYSARGGAAFLNHPLSVAHSSVAFFAQAKSVGLPEGCRSCHAAGKGIDEHKCGACHDAFIGHGQHAQLAQAGGRAASEIPVGAASPSETTRKTASGSAPASTSVLASAAQVADGASLADAHRAGAVPVGCIGCHNEHQGAARLSGLGAVEGCKRESCHPKAHEDAIFEAKTAAPVVVKAPPITSLDLSQEELHLKHANVPKRCISCHGTADGKEANAKLSCFRCHAGGQTLAVEQCRSCHVEHKGAHIARSIDPLLLARAPAAVVPARSLLSGTAVASLLFLPLTVLSFVYRSRRRQRERKLVDEIQAAPTESVKRLVHSINLAKCVGCSMCVSACPASVLELIDHKSRIVNFDACIQCKKCEVACNFDALRMHEADKPAPTVEVPDLDAFYQTTVPGLYLIGQASGVPLVKNASNLGRAVVEHAVEQGIRPGTAAAAGVDVEVVIVGSGPAGLSAALTCAKEGLSYVCLEKGRELSTTIRTYYHKGKQLLAEPPDTETVGYLPVWDTDREAILAKWDEVVAKEKLRVECESAVTEVRKEGDGFVVKTVDLRGQDKRTWRALRVILAIGSMGSPRRLGCPGDDLPKLCNSLVDQDAYDGKHVLVVGGGDAAVEVALALGAAHGGSNTVHLSYRRDKFDRIKPRNRTKLDEAIAAGRVSVLYSSTVQEVREASALLKLGDGSVQELPNDAVFCLLGGDPPMKWLQSLGVRYVHKPHSWSPERTDTLVRLRVLKS